jgi:DUF1680 family protein
MPRLLAALPIVVLAAAASTPAATIEPRPFRVPARLPDAAELLSPSRIRLDGWIGPRLAANEAKRLLAVDTVPLLAGFKKKPGAHPWIGEHVGKWLHAATLAWAYTGDPALRAKLDGVAAELVAAQEPDGYLGTYVPEQRFGLYDGADWDVWSHKYNLIGLLTYYQYTGNESALDACRKIGDLLIATFPAKKSILAAGTHVGMAATSVLEPVVLLYRLTGDERYLSFARYIVTAWDEPRGPKIVATLLKEKSVKKTANGKAYEMLSNLVGVCELARATGDRSLLEAVQNAWTDVVANRLYLTGSASAGEVFQPDHVLPNGNDAHICETCVTTTWIQLNLQLLRLTGEAKYGAELERAIYNHLAAAQHPRGDDWCYYTALEGTKPYDRGINCCHSSGPRGMALVPQTAYLTQRAAGGGKVLVVSTLETSRVTLGDDFGGAVVEQRSEFPRAGRSVLTFRLARPATFAVEVRVPVWAVPLRVRTGNLNVAIHPAGWALIPPRDWHDGDTIELGFNLSSRLVLGDHANAGRAALVWGPFVLAYDQHDNLGLPAAAAAGVVEGQPPVTLDDTKGRLEFSGRIVGRDGGDPKPATFVTFADAGAGGGRYRVWLRAPGVVGTQSVSLLLDGTESRSRPGNQAGSINDGDLESFAVTFDGRPAVADWFAVTLIAPAEIGGVIFVQGQTFHDGGWFDTRGGKPRVQVKRGDGREWETVGELADYPPTTADDRGRVRPGQRFLLRLPQPSKVVGVRVIGSPASGDNPAQAFASCAELMALGK